MCSELNSDDDDEGFLDAVRAQCQDGVAFWHVDLWADGEDAAGQDRSSFLEGGAAATDEGSCETTKDGEVKATDSEDPGIFGVTDEPEVRRDLDDVCQPAEVCRLEPMDVYEAGPHGYLAPDAVEELVIPQDVPDFPVSEPDFSVSEPDIPDSEPTFSNVFASQDPSWGEFSVRALLQEDSACDAPFREKPSSEDYFSSLVDSAQGIAPLDCHDSEKDLRVAEVTSLVVGISKDFSDVTIPLDGDICEEDFAATEDASLADVLSLAKDLTLSEDPCKPGDLTLSDDSTPPGLVTMPEHSTLAEDMTVVENPNLSDDPSATNDTASARDIPLVGDSSLTRDPLSADDSTMSVDASAGGSFVQDSAPGSYTSASPSREDPSAWESCLEDTSLEDFTAGHSSPVDPFLEDSSSGVSSIGGDSSLENSSCEDTCQVDSSPGCSAMRESSHENSTLEGTSFGTSSPVRSSPIPPMPVVPCAMLSLCVGPVACPPLCLTPVLGGPSPVYRYAPPPVLYYMLGTSGSIAPPRQTPALAAHGSSSEVRRHANALATLGLHGKHS